MTVADIFKSRRRLEADNLFFRALRRAPPGLRLHGSDRVLLVWMTRIWPSLLDISQVVKSDLGGQPQWLTRARRPQLAGGRGGRISLTVPVLRSSSHKALVAAGPNAAG